ncbi:hypothetical protein ARMGADRAFT_1022983 [Armillaria gallica]|uniref:Uncharacterized protein n=1 Tax=Armillaria gallica TaxID=47427 RepID=A0A2H3EZB3_ARMGA|nr:hypothetical protein ARMGADRAFT_1022983 [Armillaria gallica]
MTLGRSGLYVPEYGGSQGTGNFDTGILTMSISSEASATSLNRAYSSGVWTQQKSRIAVLSAWRERRVFGSILQRSTVEACKDCCYCLSSEPILVREMVWGWPPYIIVFVLNPLSSLEAHVHTPKTYPADPSSFSFIDSRKLQLFAQGSPLQKAHLGDRIKVRKVEKKRVDSLAQPQAEVSFFFVSISSHPGVFGSFGSPAVRYRWRNGKKGSPSMTMIAFLGHQFQSTILERLRRGKANNRLNVLGNAMFITMFE